MIKSTVLLAAILVVAPLNSAEAAEQLLGLGERQWTVRKAADLPDGVIGPVEPGDAWIANSTLELVEAKDAAERESTFVLAVTFISEPNGCVSLEIGFPAPGGGEELFDHVRSECVASTDRWKQLAQVARGSSFAKTVRYRISVQGQARFRQTEVMAGAADADATRTLRSRVSPVTMDALDLAIREVKARAANSTRVDWPFATAQAVAAIVDGNTRRDALPGVQKILAALRDKHSWVTVLDDEGRLTANGKILSYQAPQFRLQGSGTERVVGWLTIPWLAATGGLEAQKYADTIRDGLAQAVKADACGVVVDLVGHSGGNMWPGLEGLGPLFGDGAEVGAFKRGQAWRIERKAQDEASWLWREEVARLPVAVILGPETASSGEAIAIAFVGRPNTEFFGRRTRGLATSNQTIPLGEGMVAFVMTSEMADRNGRTFPKGIAPPREDRNHDEAGRRALEWLFEMKNCHRLGAAPGQRTALHHIAAAERAGTE